MSAISCLFRFEPLKLYILFTSFAKSVIMNTQQYQKGFPRLLVHAIVPAIHITRKKDISNLNYLIITEDKIPQNLTTDAKKSLETLCGQKMLNLSSMSNTDLKLEYGVANLDELSACDDRFSTFERNAAIYAQELSDAGYTDQARQLLEFAVSCHVDNSSIYTQLAAIYQTGGNLSGILQLQEAAAQLAPFPQKIILEKLKSFQP